MEFIFVTCIESLHETDALHNTTISHMRINHWTTMSDSNNFSFLQAIIASYSISFQHTRKLKKEILMAQPIQKY